MPPTLEEVEALALQLSEADRLKLSEHLKPGRKPLPSPEQVRQAVENFRRAGERLAASTGPSIVEQLDRDRDAR